MSRYEHQQNGTIRIVFCRSNQPYSYGPKRVRILDNPERITLTGQTKVEVNGIIWDSAIRVHTFTHAEDSWSRIFYRNRNGEAASLQPASRVRVLTLPPLSGTANDVRTYWDRIVAGLDADNPLRIPYDRVDFNHPESALYAYLNGAPIPPPQSITAPIFPFRCNLSQRQAVEYGLRYPVSVIEGPPGTGKTETILNLVANIVVRHHTVGVVSHTNTAVDNVREKLTGLGFGHILADLGNKDKQERFFEQQRQDDRNKETANFVSRNPGPADLDRLNTVDIRLRRLQDTERRRAQRRHEVEAYRLEQRHFEQHLHRHEIPDLTGLPLLRRSSERILDYVAESDFELRGARPGLLRRIVKYFRYGSLRGLDPGDSNAVLRLQQAYYDKRIAELDAEIARLDGQLQRTNFEQLAREHHELSIQVLHAELAARYQTLPRTIYEKEKYKQGNNFTNFIRDYPVVLSTCHSLRNSLPSGFLLDYLVIDEASQVDPLVAALALSCSRRIIVVGDTQQLPPIPPESAAELTPPSAVYDTHHHSILSSLNERHGDALPRTLLREHYRCDPAIIGFCNKKFYDHQLIPYTSSGASRPVIVVRTAEGNHMRVHREGGRSNQREIDVVETEVIPQHCAEIDDNHIGVTTPYRIQANKVGELLDPVDVNTVHKFQGQQKRVIVLTTVLDETWRGYRGLRFVDNPQLVNVAVSRAMQRFIVVTNHDMMPKSRHIRDLVGYIRYHNPEEDVVNSDVISIFDLLYREYSQRLRSLAHRVKKRFSSPAENIAGTVLDDTLGEEEYAHLTVVPQVLLSHLFPDTSRLASDQARFVGNRASVDFVIYNRISNEALLAIEIDGFEYHENDPKQRERDALKDAIFRFFDVALLRLPTTGSQEQPRIRQAINDAEARRAPTTS